MSGREQRATRARRILSAALPGGLVVAVAPGQDGSGRRLDVTVQAGGVDHCFIAGWAGEGWPADVEELHRLVPGVEVALAVNLSGGARERLARLGVGWVDEAGHASVNRPSGLVIVREPPGPAAKPEPAARWSRSTLAVAEAALSGVVPTVENIEAATGSSRNATAVALRRLEKFGFLGRSGARRGPRSGRRIVDEEALTTAYVAAAAEHRSKLPSVLVHRLWVGDALETLRTEIAPALDSAGGDWAVTGAAASVLLAPYLSDVSSLDVYVDPELMTDRARLAARLGGRLVDRGHVIVVRPVPTPIAATGPRIEEVRVALPVRVYADLLAAGGRSAEAAHHLKEVRGVRCGS